MWETSFQVALGDWGNLPLESYREVDFLVFLICCTFNIIVLLNLLIAIICKSFDTVIND